jgi:hypothetical protein
VLLFSIYETKAAQTTNTYTTANELSMDTLVGADTIYYLKYYPEEIQQLLALAQQCPLSGSKKLIAAMMIANEIFVE